MANEEQLRKLAQIFNTDKIISPEEITAVLESIIGILAQNKKSIEALNAESKQTLEDSLQSMAENHNSIVDQLNEKTDSTARGLEERVNALIADSNTKLEAMLAEIRGLMPKDGKDADEASIVSSVLAQIKLPEYKETVLDSPEVIRNKLETLEGEERLDAKAIKNLSKFIQNTPNVGGIRYFENLADVSIPITDKRQDLLAQFNTTNQRWESGIAITVATTAPASPKVNDLWVDIS